MASISAASIQMKAREDPDGLATVFCRSLKESYHSLTVDRVREAIDRWLAKEKAQGVIDMFVFGWLNEGVDD